MIEMYKIENNEIEKVAALLCQAFQNYPMHKWIFSTEKNHRYIQYIFNRACAKYCMKYGHAWKTSDLEAILLVKRPNDTGISIWKYILSGMLKLHFTANETTLKRMEYINSKMLDERNKIMGKTKHWHPWVMATSPNKQHRGLGGKVAEYMINIAINSKMPIFAQTSYSDLIPFYKSLGFNIESQFTIENQLTVTTMTHKASHPWQKRKSYP